MWSAAKESNLVALARRWFTASCPSIEHAADMLYQRRDSNPHPLSGTRSLAARGYQLHHSGIAEGRRIERRTVVPPEFESGLPPLAVPSILRYVKDSNLRGRYPASPFQGGVLPLDQHTVAEEGRVELPLGVTPDDGLANRYIAALSLLQMSLEDVPQR